MSFLQKLWKKNEIKDGDIVSPVTGTIIATKDIADSVFAQEIMGQTIGIVPEEGIVVCPVNGKVEVLFPTGHAFGIKGNDGNSYLVHIGIETVNLRGKGFTTWIKQGQNVKAGQKAVDVDLQYVKSNGLDTTVMLIVTEKKDDCNIQYVEKSNVIKAEKINQG